MKRQWIVLAGAAGLVATAVVDAGPSGGARGKGSRQGVLPPAAELESISVLRSATPEPLLWFLLLETRGGLRTVLGRDALQLAPPEGPRTLGIDFEVDLQQGSYTTRWAGGKPPRAAIEASRAQRPEGRRVAGRGLGVDAAPQADLAYESGASYWVRYQVQTWEPARYVYPVEVLNKTTAYVEWSACPAGSQIDVFSPSCWANPSTFVATTWYTQSCSSSGGQGNDYASASGHYYNWDFGLDILRTDARATANVDVWGSFGATTWFTFDASGEASWFLSGHTEKQESSLWTNRCSSTGTTGGGGGGDVGGGSTGGGSTGGGGGGSFGETCIDIEDGITGQVLGECCGYTTAEIVDCAAGFLAE